MQQGMLCQKNRALRHGLGEGLNCIYKNDSTKIQQNQKERIGSAIRPFRGLHPAVTK
jgi:hypothetical protein